MQAAAPPGDPVRQPPRCPDDDEEEQDIQRAQGADRHPDHACRVQEEGVSRWPERRRMDPVQRVPAVLGELGRQAEVLALVGEADPTSQVHAVDQADQTADDERRHERPVGPGIEATGEDVAPTAALGTRMIEQ